MESGEEQNNRQERRNILKQVDRRGIRRGEMRGIIAIREKNKKKGKRVV